MGVGGRPGGCGVIALVGEAPDFLKGAIVQASAILDTVMPTMSVELMFGNVEAAKVDPAIGVNVVCHTAGDDQEACKKAAQIIVDALTEDRRTVFRTMPEAETHKDFSTMKTLHRGYCRFSVWPGRGTKAHAPGIFGYGARELDL